MLNENDNLKAQVDQLRSSLKLAQNSLAEENDSRVDSLVEQIKLL